MAGPGRPGRKKKYEVKGWAYLPVRVPVEVFRAVKIECFKKDVKYSEFVRDLLEKHLERAGSLKMTIARDATGHEVRSYQVIEPPR